MNMTHYMELWASNQPWNLIIFMAIPMTMAETLAIAELYLLYTRKLSGKVASFSKALGVLVGVYFLVVAVYLIFNVAIPLSVHNQWRTIIDVTAVWAYILSALPMIYISFLRLGWIAKTAETLQKVKLHAIAISVFLVLSHIAMIAGMMSPAVLGWQPQAMPMSSMQAPMDMHHHH